MNNESENYTHIERFALDRGADLFGVADISPHKEKFRIHPPRLLDKMDRAVSMGIHLSDAVFETIIDRPNKIYSRHYKMANMMLDQLALQVGGEIQRMGYDYLPIPASQLLDWDELTSHASHRAIGQLAGLGWRGRSSLLVNPRYGGRVRYVSVLTDMPLTPGTPMENRCGSCRACINACPAGAITEEGYDMDKCHRMLQHFGKTLHVSLICGVCQKACRGKELDNRG